jgi:hypothetical protein
MRLLAQIGSGVAALWLVMSLTYPFGWDQGLFAWVGGVIVQGGLPYRDAWDFKGPLVYYAYAIAQSLFGIHLWSIRILDAALALLATAAVWQSASALTDRTAGRWAALIFFLWYASHSFWHTAQPDGWAAMLLVIALGPLITGSRPASPMRLGAAGLAIGAATLFKPLYAAFLVLPLLHVVLVRPPRRIALAASLVGGWLVLIVGVLGWFAAQGGLDELVAVHIGFAATYVQISPEDPLRALGNYFLSSRVIAVALPLAVYGFVVLWRTARQPAALLLGGWVGLVVVFVTLQNRFYAYHWLPILPAMTLLGTAGLYEVVSRQRTLAGIACATIMIHCLTPILLEEARFLAWVAGRIDRAAYYDGYGEPGADMRAVRWLREQGQPGTVFIFGWHSSVAWLSERSTVSRFGYSLPLMLGGDVSLRQTYRAEALRALALDPPRYIVVGIQAAQITGERMSMLNFPELAELVETRYRPAAHFGRITILERVE